MWVGWGSLSRALARPGGDTGESQTVGAEQKQGKGQKWGAEDKREMEPGLERGRVLINTFLVLNKEKLSILGDPWAVEAFYTA